MVWSLVKRNIKIYFREPVSVFFSMLGALIVLLLYVLFLSKVQVDDIAKSMPGIPMDDISFLVNAWVMGGILSISTVTTGLGSMGTMVYDSVLGVLKDFRTAPLRRWQLVLGYLISSLFSSLIINTLLLIAAEVYIALSGGQLLAWAELLKVLGLTALCCFSFTSISGFLTTFTKTPSAFGGLSTIMGTLLGFLSGAYMPIGVFSESVQMFIKILPFSYSAALFRDIFTRVPMDLVFSGAPAGVKAEFLEYFGITVEAFGYTVSPLAMVLIILGFGILFFMLAVLRMSRKVDQ